MATELNTKLQKIANDYTECSLLADEIISGTSAYKELQYIQSNALEYIDTGIIPTNHYIEIKFQCLNTNNTGIFAGGLDEECTNKYHLTWFFNAQDRWFFAEGSGESSAIAGSGIKCTDVCTVKYNYNNSLIINNQTLSTSINANGTGKSICLLRRPGLTLAVMKLFYCKIYDKSNNTLVRDFIPVWRISKDSACLYDKISQQFFMNAGVGGFIAGPEKGV